ncbi:hypothetical protein JCM17380_16540 [Desulfosporosinus burensis]
MAIFDDCEFVYFFSEMDFNAFKSKVLEVYKVYNGCLKVDVQRVITVKKSIEVGAHQLSKGTKLIEIVIYGKLNPFPTELEILKLLFGESIPEIHVLFLNELQQQNYNTSEYLDINTIVFQLDDDFMEVVDFQVQEI